MAEAEAEQRQYDADSWYTCPLEVKDELYRI